MPPLRVATFNVHHCEGLDGRIDVGRVAAAVATTDADLVALQEVDRNMERSGRVDQPRALEQLLRMTMTFHPTLHRGGGEYGLAIATRFTGGPFEFRALPLAGDEEPRGLLMGPWQGITVVATHLSLRADARRLQTDALVELVGSLDGPYVVLGDLNQGPLRLRRATRRRLQVGWWPRRTMARRWSQRDHIVAGGGARVGGLRAYPTNASDHRPLAADLTVA